MGLAERLYGGASVYLDRKHSLYQNLRAQHWPIIPPHRTFEFNGERHSIAEWSRITGLHRRVITTRLWRGWTVERTLTTPV